MYRITALEVTTWPPLHWAAACIAVLVIAWRFRRDAQLLGFASNLTLAIAGYLAYVVVRGASEGAAYRAEANAYRIVDLERRLGLLQEDSLQHVIIGKQWAVNLANWAYVWGHWPVIIAFAAWLMLAHPQRYRLYRNAFLVSGALSLLCFGLFPVAPPRLINLDMIDTVTVHSESYRLLQPPALVNQYAAVPSLHFGWNLLVGIAVIGSPVPSTVKVMMGLLPLLMGFAVVVTANHFIVDLVAGGAVVLLGLYLAKLWETRVARQQVPSRRSVVPFEGTP